MRLIDADRLKEAVTTDYYEHYTQCHDTDQIALIDMVENDIDESETIAPETLPIVRELREQVRILKTENESLRTAGNSLKFHLEKVTAERDAAIKDLYSVICDKLEACDFCKNKSIDCDKCTSWVGQEGWEWRGIREGRSDGMD